MFLCVPVTKGAQFDQFVWPKTLRSQFSTYNIDQLQTCGFAGSKVKINTHVGIDVMLTENNCTHHYKINADLKTTLLVKLVITIELSDGGANAKCKP